MPDNALVTKFFEQLEGASKTADLVNNADGVRKRSCVQGGVIRWLGFNPTRGLCPAHRRSNQRDELALGISIAVDVPLSGLD